ncbi:hypothetical protein HLB23_28500 [Nocardia uniformis]|uniref:Uncharacterized protein n=1 Tax=Nocardia uniformis TaxID=53432 RepID=A0A849CEH0_9NOCA|nr:hypothetical protein [Nocardia uniformis]NNH73749.1 hypothetical protein [Nocardia uniformis]
MVTAIWTFLTGLGLGGLVVWVLVSYTAVNPAPSSSPKECWTVQNITARIERERLDASRPARVGGPVGCG